MCIFSPPAAVELQAEPDHGPKVWVCSRGGLQDHHLWGQSLKPNLYGLTAGFQFQSPENDEEELISDDMFFWG